MIHFWAKTTPEGKPGISVYDHMVNVGCVARCIAEASPNILERFHLRAKEVGALAALHDLGKISPGFQRKCEAWLEENGLTNIARNGCWDTGMEADHGKVSHAAIQAFLTDSGMDRKTAKFVSTVLGAHHGRLTPPNDRGYRPQKGISETQSHIDWDAERRGNAEKIWKHFVEGDASFTVPDTSPALWWLAGLTSVADWIGSDESFFSPDRGAIDEDFSSIARNALDSIGFIPPYIKENLTFESLFGFQPNDMQEKTVASVTGPGVYVIEAPMGMGKTEAALWTAYQLMSAGKASGIYFALPTQATSNRMHIRMNEFVRRISGLSSASRLIHGNAWLMDQTAGLMPVATGPDTGGEDARTGRDWFSSAKRALIAPFGVGTIDQALLGVVAAKHFFVRHFALSGKVVILDEVHSYDLYTGTLIDKLISTLEGLGCTVIVLSATLTGRRRGQIVSSQMDTSKKDEELPYPLITGRKEGLSVEPAAARPPESRTIKVDFIPVDKAAEEAVKLARKGGAVLWICNTVDAAQKQYRRFIKHAGEEFPIGLLHSRFPFWKREEIEDEWMARFGKDSKTRCGSILVSTQIVEQSVDLDADLMVSELAPTDMLLQRLGRLWRHERENRPVDTAQLFIIEEEKNLEEFRSMESKAIAKALGSKAKVYAPYVLLRSLELWKTQPQISIPLQIRQLIEATYKDRDNEPASWQELSFEWFGTDSAKEMLASRNCNLWQVALEDEEGIQTRLNEMPTFPLVLCRNITDHEAVFIDLSKGLLGQYRLATAQAIHKNLVRIPRRYFDHVETCPAFSDYLYGEQSAGIVSEDGKVEVKGLKSGIRLVYSADMGLVIEKISGKEEQI